MTTPSQSSIQILPLGSTAVQPAPHSVSCLKAVSTPADGDCLFHAVQAAENSTAQSHVEIRWLTSFALLVGVRDAARMIFENEE